MKKAAKMKQQNNFKMIKYEDIVSNPKEKMETLSGFLGIKYKESLVTPTIMGIPDRPNTSHIRNIKKTPGVISKSFVGKYKKSLSKKEKEDITIEFSNLMDNFNYDKEHISNFYKQFKSPFLKIKLHLYRIIISSITKLKIYDK